MGTVDYKSSWARRIWQLLEATSVNITSDDISLSVVSDRTRKVRQGEVYHFSHIFQEVLNDQNGDILIVTGTNRVTLTLSTSLGAESETRFYEGTSVTNNGTLTTTANRNRYNIGNSFTSSVYHTPTISSLGVLINEDYFPAGLKNKEVGSSSEETSVWILKPNTNYLFRITNTSNSTEKAQISGDIFEDIA